MELITSIDVMQTKSELLRTEGKKIGVVPTMGYLHDGHISLMKKACELSDVLVTTLFVNPTQFGPGEDFERYPRDLERDKAIAAGAGTDILFSPETRAMYPEGYETYVQVEGVSTILEGKFRPIHFRGVTTIVAKLFHVTKPHVAVFGQKDAQQAFIIRKMVRDLNFDVSIVVAPIVREPDGLAVSSRNIYLNPEDRKNATSLYRALVHAEERIKSGERSLGKLRKELEDILLQSEPTQIDYVAFVQPETFQEIDRLESSSVFVLMAAKFGSTRLIDNELIQLERNRN